MLEAAGYIGMGEDEFWHSTPRYFAARQRGFSDGRIERAELLRIHAFLTLSPNLKKGAYPTPADLWPMPHDAPKKQIEVQAPPLDPENDPDFKFLRLKMQEQQKTP